MDLDSWDMNCVQFDSLSLRNHTVDMVHYAVTFSESLTDCTVTGEAVAPMLFISAVMWFMANANGLLTQ